MALTDPVFTLAGLIEVALPSRTVRLCDGGFVDWTARGLFVSADAEFGTLESVQQVTEAVSDEAPSLQMTLLPPSASAASDLFLPDAQGSAMMAWLAEIDPADGQILGDPELRFSGFLDTLTLTEGREGRKVDMTFVSAAERLFWTKEGNVLSPRFHKSVWPGELGLDHATGVQFAVPWGVPGPPRGTVSGGGSGGGGGFSGGGFINLRLQ